MDLTPLVIGVGAILWLSIAILAFAFCRITVLAQRRGVPGVEPLPVARCSSLEAPQDRGERLIWLTQLAVEVDDVALTPGHAPRTARAAAALAREAGWPEERVLRLAQAALVHDVGKLGVAEETLRQASPLDDRQRRQIRLYTARSAELAEGALDAEQLAWIRHHHERLDGSGYPSGLTGEEIPYGAMLLAVADTWDAMTHPRAYREAVPRERALELCRRAADTQFPASAVRALATVISGPEASPSRGHPTLAARSPCGETIRGRHRARR